MTKQIKSISPEYNSFYIAGRANVDIPIGHVATAGIVSTSQCINVSCLYYNDGDTTVEMAAFEEVGETSSPQFDAILLTPDRVVIVFETNEPEIMRADVPGMTTRVRIWTNHPTEPDRVRIGLG